MSLNRTEQAIYDYMGRHPEERQYIHDKVRALAAGAEDTPKAVSRIDAELWRYCEERSSVVPALREAARLYGIRRTSMKNLAEFLIRLWIDPRPKKPPNKAERQNLND
jgi:hypothetical protein